MQREAGRKKKKKKKGDMCKKGGRRWWPQKHTENGLELKKKTGGCLTSLELHCLVWAEKQNVT